MKRSPMDLAPGAIALLVLVVLGAQTLSALRVTGSFGVGPHSPRLLVAPAIRTLEGQLAASPKPSPVAPPRDPFSFRPAVVENPSGAPAPTAVRVRPTPAAAPVAPAEPVLTAILFDNDPRALLRWKDRDWTVRQGGLFDEFQVVAISRTQVTLRRGEATLVLQRRNPGDTP